MRCRDFDEMQVDLLGDTGGVEEDVNLAVVVDNVADGLLDGTTVTDVDLVEANVDTGLLGELASGLLAELLLDIHDGNATDTDLREGLGHVEAETTTTAVKESC